MPSIAVIMPVRDGMEFLPGPIECVRSQGYSPLDLIVVDDGSVDGSLEYARGAGLHTLQTPGVGPSQARNVGIRAASCDLIAFLDVDDLWPQGSLERLTAALATDPEAGF